MTIIELTELSTVAVLFITVLATLGVGIREIFREVRDDV